MATRSQVVLALDLGTKLGWAIFHGTKRHKSGLIVFKRRTRNKVKEPRAVTYVQFMDALEQSFTNGDPIPLVRRPDVIAYEHARGHWLNASSRESFGALLGQLEIFALHHSVPIVGIPQTVIKKYATGRGNARKDEMIKAARRLWRGVRLASDDEADALHIGRTYAEGGYP